MSTGRSECVRWLASGDRASLRSSLRTSPVSTGRVRCDAVERPVVLCRRACAVAVGGNGRVQTASETWLTPEHRTLGVERPVTSASAREEFLTGEHRTYLFRLAGVIIF